MVTQIRTYFSMPLFVNSYILITMRVAATGMGFVFWAAAARMMPTEQLGIATGILAGTTLLSSLAKLGLGYAVIRYLAHSDKPRSLLNVAFSISGIVSIILSVTFLVGLPLWAPDIQPLREALIPIILFIVLVLSWTLALLLHSVFVAMRQPRYSLYRQVGHAILAVTALLIINALGLTESGYIVATAAHAIGAFLSVILGFYLLHRARPSYRYAVQFRGVLKSDMRRFSLTNYVTDQFQRSPETVLPLYVINLLGPSAGAYFFIVWTMGKGSATWITSSLAESLFAEGSNEPSRLTAHAWQSVKLGLMLSVGFVVGMATVGRFFLSIYGEEFVNQGYVMLVLVALAIIPNMMVSQLVSVLRIQNRMRAVMTISVAGNSLGVAASIVGLMHLGLPGAGIGWLTSKTLIFVVSVIWWRWERIKLAKARVTRNVVPLPSMADAVVSYASQSRAIDTVQAISANMQTRLAINSLITTGEQICCPNCREPLPPFAEATHAKAPNALCLTEHFATAIKARLKIDTPDDLQKRLEAIQLLDDGQRPAAVATLLNVHPSTVYRWRRRWLDGDAEFFGLIRNNQNSSNGSASSSVTVSDVPVASSKISCSNCNVSYSIDDGILDLIPNQDFYHGVINQERMQQVIESAAKQGWLPSICQHLSHQRDLISQITDPAIVGWFYHCYDPNATDVCLEVGSNWGSNSFALSRFYGRVYSIDVAKDKLRFQAIRAKQAGVDNITLLHCGYEQIPLPNHSVDLILINDPLPQINLGSDVKNQDDNQLGYLAEIKRVLKPSGVVCFGVDNRISTRVGFAVKNVNGRLGASFKQFAGLLPTLLTSNIRRKTRAYNQLDTVFSPSSWKADKLLREAGFSKISRYWVWPNTSLPRMSGTLDAVSTEYVANRIRYQLDNRWLAALIGFGLQLPTGWRAYLTRWFLPYHLIVARLQAGETAAEKILLSESPASGNFVRQTMGTNHDTKTTFLSLDRRANVKKVIRFSEHSSAHDGRSILDYQSSEGIAGIPFRPTRLSNVKAAASWLVDFQHTTKLGEWSTSELEEEINDLVNSVTCLPDIGSLAEDLKAFTNIYLQSTRSYPIPIVEEHGDFTPTNLIVTSDGRVRPVDWEYRRKRGNPLLDVGGFYYSLLQHTNNLDTNLKDKNNVLSAFAVEYNRAMPLPLFVAPSYYLLRVLYRHGTRNYQSDPGVYFAVSSRLEKLQYAINYSLSSITMNHV